MPSKILKSCTACGDCLEVCPTNSILSGEKRYVIDTDSCEDCAVCIPICPVGAIQVFKGLSPNKPKVEQKDKS